jgi:hypothetical protein
MTILLHSQRNYFSNYYYFFLAFGSYKKWVMVENDDQFSATSKGGFGKVRWTLQRFEKKKFKLKKWFTIKKRLRNINKLAQNTNKYKNYFTLKQSKFSFKMMRDIYIHMFVMKIIICFGPFFLGSFWSTTTY